MWIPYKDRSRAHNIPMSTPLNMAPLFIRLTVAHFSRSGVAEALVHQRLGSEAKPRSSADAPRREQQPDSVGPCGSFQKLG